MKAVQSVAFESPDKIRAVQEEGMRTLLHYVAANSRFYRRLFEQNSIDANAIQTLDDFSSIPVTTKDDMQKHNWDFLCVPRSEIAEFTSTSGTLGHPVTIALTNGDLERLAFNEYNSFTCAGTGDADVFQLMLTLDRQFMAGIAYYSGIRKLGAAVVRVGPGLPAMQLEAIERIKPTVLVAVPSFLVRLIDFAKANNIDLNQSTVKKVVCIGESIRKPDLSLNIVGSRIASSWNVQLYGTYASTEMQTAFTECDHGVGGHLQPDLIIVELLDDNNQPVAPGMPGEVTITTLGVEGMPLIRYKTGDICIAHMDPCKCGRNTLRLGPVIGRKQQLIKFKGTTLYPQGIFEIINEVSCVRDYVVEAETNPLGLDELRLYIVTEGPYEDDAVKTLAAAFQSRLRVVPQINLTSMEALEKMQHGGGGRKARKFIDNRVSNT